MKLKTKQNENAKMNAMSRIKQEFPDMNEINWDSLQINVDNNLVEDWPHGFKSLGRTITIEYTTKDQMEHVKIIRKLF